MHVLFLCPHAAAKSVIATAMLRDLAGRDGLDIVTWNAGTEPDEDLNPTAIDALARRGLTYTEPPTTVSSDDIARADVIVTFGCQISEMPGKPQRWVDWSDAPNVSDDVDGFVTLVESRLPDLLAPI